MKVAKLWACAVVFAIAIGAAAARAEESVLRVGIITDMSGQYSDGNGSGSVIAAQMAAEEIGGSVAGRKIEIISGDHQNKADIASAIVREWIDTKHVDVVAEGVNSAVALAVMNVTRERNKPFLISGAGSSDITGKYCTPTSIQWTYDTYASSNATAKAVVARGGKSWFFITADYSFGHALERDASKAVIAAGGKVLGAVRHPFNTSDMSSFLLQAQAAKPDIVGLANAGSDFRNAVAQADEFGIRAGGAKIVALQVTLTDVPALGLEHAHDLLSPIPSTGIARQKRGLLPRSSTSATAPCRARTRPASTRHCATTSRRSPPPIRPIRPPSSAGCASIRSTISSPMAARFARTAAWCTTCI